MTQNKLMDISINVTKFSCFNLFSSGDLQSQQESKERQRTIKHKLCLESSIENLICAPINYYNQIVALLRPWKMQHFIMNGFLWKAKRNHDNILNCIHLWVVLFFFAVFVSDLKKKILWMVKNRVQDGIEKILIVSCYYKKIHLIRLILRDHRSYCNLTKFDPPFSPLFRVH